LEVPGNPSYVLQYSSYGGSYSALPGTFPITIQATKSDGNPSSTILETEQQIEFKFEDIYLVPGFNVTSGGSLGDGVLDPPWEPVSFVNPQSGGSFNKLLRLKDLYDPASFDTTTLTWKDILFQGNTLIGNYNNTTNIEPEAIFISTP
jgi:hypothetical protein